tara:strand:+ start:430 stop:1260 length:831 start_codon:yes stop_codon:yes gene_type:complete
MLFMKRLIRGGFQFIELWARHPLASGLCALLGLFGLIFAIYSYQKDRSESRSSTLQVSEVQQQIQGLREVVEAQGRDWQVMDDAFYGIRVGGPVDVAYDAPFERISRQAVGSRKTLKWLTPEGNYLTTTFDSHDNRVLQIVVDWGGRDAQPETGISDFAFGQTTLQDIRDRFDSNGFAYAMKMMHETDGGIVTYNAFELKDTPSIIVVFKTMLGDDDRVYIETLPPERQVLGEIGAYFRLVGITVADEDFLDSIWGKNKIYDAKSAPIALMKSDTE